MSLDIHSFCVSDKRIRLRFLRPEMHAVTKKQIGQNFVDNIESFKRNLSTCGIFVITANLTKFCQIC